MTQDQINDCEHLAECLEGNCCACGPEQHTLCRCPFGCRQAYHDPR